MDPRQLSWDDLQYFLAVARTGQLSRAAYVLQSSHVTVARHVERLEAALQVPLFHRGPKGYALTSQGAQLLDVAERFQAEASQLPALLSGAAPEILGQMRLNMPEGICSLFCTRLLPRFRQHFPQLTLELAAIQQLSNFTPNATDLSVLLEPPKSRLYDSEKLADYTLRVYGSRDYLARNSPITGRETLLSHDFIGYIDSMVFMPSLDYLAEVAPKLRADLQCSSIFSQMQAVRDGLGLAVLPDFLAARHAELIPVLAETITLRRGYWLSCRSDLREAPREGAVIAALRQAFAALAAEMLPNG